MRSQFDVEILDVFQKNRKNMEKSPLIGHIAKIHLSPLMSS